MVLWTSGPTIKFIILQKTAFCFCTNRPSHGPRWLGPVVHRRVIGWFIGLLNIFDGLDGWSKCPCVQKIILNVMEQ